MTVRISPPYPSGLDLGMDVTALRTRSALSLPPLLPLHTSTWANAQSHTFRQQPKRVEGTRASSCQIQSGPAGASRASVARALATLRELGFVSTGRREVAVLDLAGLREFAG
jgi:hypothetical protein